jgi:L-serine dehydratase
VFISVFDIFKIGVGPSSSHTMGPMTAAAAFLNAVRDGAGGAFEPATVTGLEAQLYGSLAFTGKGHATDRAVILGLMGFEPHSLDADAAEADLSELRATGRLAPPGLPEMAFDPERHVIFDYGPPLLLHANGMKLRALRDGVPLLEETYY